MTALGFMKFCHWDIKQPNYICSRGCWVIGIVPIFCNLSLTLVSHTRWSLSSCLMSVTLQLQLYFKLLSIWTMNINSCHVYPSGFIHFRPEATVVKWISSLPINRVNWGLWVPSRVFLVFSRWHFNQAPITIKLLPLVGQKKKCSSQVTHIE